MDTFAERLRYYRERAGYSQKELSDLIGVSVAAYNKYETRGNEPKLEILIKLANALNTDVNTLVGYQQSTNIDKEKLFFSLLHELPATVEIKSTKTGRKYFIVTVKDYPFRHRTTIKQYAIYFEQMDKIYELANNEYAFSFSSILEKTIERYSVHHSFSDDVERKLINDNSLESDYQFYILKIIENESELPLLDIDIDDSKK